ncbi:MAG: hypothetical protein F6K17_20370 [Okeania sp. SIO3C4]|nr:hypothetical protein [Okeania sp. SIO3B3]NER04787.1 hypothetical protein [Okeania sp. SIO3C4]
MITCPSDAAFEHLDSIDIVIPWMANIDASIIASGNFGLVQEFGVGIETIDIEAATHAGVWVAHIPGSISSNADSVAEHAIMLMLMLSRHMASTQQSSKAEDWRALLHECCDRNFSPEEKLISEERILLCSFLADNSVSYD